MLGKGMEQMLEQMLGISIEEVKEQALSAKVEAERIIGTIIYQNNLILNKCNENNFRIVRIEKMLELLLAQNKIEIPELEEPTDAGRIAADGKLN